MLTCCEYALWLRAASVDPDHTGVFSLSDEQSLEDALTDLLRTLREPYCYKATIATPYGYERFWRISCPITVPSCSHSSREMVALLWPRLVTDGIDPRAVPSVEALALLAGYAEEDPSSPFAAWSRAALAADDRLFADAWNHRRASLVRARLLIHPHEESEVLL